MPFPETRRVIYQTNPLEQVACLLHFPPILRIEAESPAPFQDRLRNEYPLFQETRHAQLPVGLPPEIAGVVRENLPKSGRIFYEFLSGDRIWSVALGGGVLGLKTVKYERWEAFRKRLQHLVKWLVDLYQPAFFSRLSLRYVDVIRRSRLGLDRTAPWSELLEPHIAGELVPLQAAADVELATRWLRVKLREDCGHVLLKHGLTLDHSKEICFVIDGDFFLERQIGADGVLGALDALNRRSGRLFRWCIRDELHEAMGPAPA